jgi:hypothetical protein
MTPQELHQTLESALSSRGPVATTTPAKAWPVFKDVCVPVAQALPAGELLFQWGTEVEDGVSRFYIALRCINWYIKEPWLDDSEADLWWVELEFTRPPDVGTDLLGSGDHFCMVIHDPDTFAPGVEALPVLPAVAGLEGWQVQLTWERDDDD